MVETSKPECFTGKNTIHQKYLTDFFYSSYEGQSQIQLDYCTSYGPGLILDYTVGHDQRTYSECTGCDTDPNRNMASSTCECNNGYYFDGTNCVAQVVGIIQQEDFEDPTTLTVNWDKKDSESSHSVEILANTVINSNVVHFTEKRVGGDIFYDTYFSGLKYDSQMWFIYDYHLGSSCNLLSGVNTYGVKPADVTWTIATNPYPGAMLMDATPGNSWGHVEFQLQNIHHDMPYQILIEDYDTGGPISSNSDNNCYVDNIILASTHGPMDYNIGAHQFVYPTFMILSHDYTGFDGQNTSQQQFNFEINKMNEILGRNDWKNEQFALYIEVLDIVVEVVLYDNSQYNGGAIGRGHGRFVDNTSYTDQQYFVPGQYLSFDNSFSRNQADFQRQTGTARYEGPFKNSNQNLGVCFNNCQDFASFDEAIFECNKHAACNGVKYTHKLWGGSSSQGFNTGYGFQLRENGVETNNRHFEFSYKKRDFISNDTWMYREYCKNTGDSLVFEKAYDHKGMRIRECTICESTDTNRESTTPNCPCRKGYYDDGTQCQQRTQIGVIYEDNFDTGALSDKWIGNSDDNNAISASIVSKNGSSHCVNFSQRKDNGDLFFQKTYQTQQYNEEIIVMFDYVDEGNAGLAFGFSYLYPGDYKWIHTSSSAEAGNSYPGPQIPKTQAGGWSHFEAIFPTFHDIPFRIMFQEHISTSNESFMDNFVLSTVHGPQEIRQSPYSNFQPALMILGNDFTGFDGSAATQQFSFNKADLDGLLGRSFVNGEKFAVYIENADLKETIQVFDGNNGAELGDSHGKFEDSSPYLSTLVFKPGDWIVFSKDFTTEKSSFKLEKGSCQFEGPLREQNQNLELCFDNCRDFATLQEAMDSCMTEALCNGISYSHKYWGGSSSTGFDRGYGFQLRSSQPTPSRSGLKRKFEYSYKKIENPGYFQQLNEFQCTKCDDGCATCSEAGSCDISCPVNCEICNPDETCITAKDGYYVDPITQQPKKCDDGCATCSQSGQCILSCNAHCNICEPDKTCTQAEDGYYVRNPDKTAQKCDDGCATCSSAGSCTLDCLPNCIKCKPDQTCTESDEGFYIDPITKIVNNCNHEKCATCQDSSDNCILPCEIGCLRCNAQNICQEAEDGNFIDNESNLKKCDNRVCATCETSARNCIEECNPGCGLCDITKKCLSCKLPLILENHVCEACNEKCEFCNPEDKDMCYSCSGRGVGRVQDASQNCGCMEGYYEKQGTLDCQKCEIDNCKVCDSDLVCTQCSNPDLLPPLCQVPKKGFFVGKNQDGSSTVGHCEAKCETCSNNWSCDTCVNQTNRMKVLPCNCMKGYHDNRGSQKQCIPCPEYCLDCVESDICLECDDSKNRELNHFTNLCQCSSGYKEKNGECKRCYMYKGECLLQCGQNTVANEDNHVCEHLSYELSDNIVLFWVCALVLISIFFLSVLWSVRIQKRKFLISNQNRIEEEQKERQN